MGHHLKTDECDSCHWETEELVEVDCYARTPGQGPFTDDEDKVWAWMCHVCRNSFAGLAYQYPRHYENQPLFATVAWGINYIASLVKEI